MRCDSQRFYLSTIWEYIILKYFFSSTGAFTHGVTKQNAKRKAVLIQFIAPSETWKYAAEVVEIAEKVSHYRAVSRIAHSMCAWGE